MAIKSSKMGVSDNLKLQYHHQNDYVLLINALKQAHLIGFAGVIFFSDSSTNVSGGFYR